MAKAVSFSSVEEKATGEKTDARMRKAKQIDNIFDAGMSVSSVLSFCDEVS